MSPFRKFLFNLHLVIGLTAGLFLLILATTGCIIAFEPEIDHALNPSLYRVVPAGAPLSLDEQAGKVTTAFPDAQIRMIIFATASDLAPNFTLSDRNHVFLDPYRGEILGVRGRAFTDNAHQFHIRLLSGKAGEWITTLAGISMIPLILAGLYLWWPLKRIGIQTGRSSRRLIFDLHNSVGFFSSLFLLVFALTGTIIGFDEVSFPLIYALTGTGPLVRPTAPPAKQGAEPPSLEQMVAAARHELPGAQPALIAFPVGKSPFRVGMNYPEDHVLGGRSGIWIDPNSGDVLAIDDYRKAPLGPWLTWLNRSLHTGDIYGVPSKAFACLICLALMIQVFSGPYLWWTRRKRKPSA